MTPYSFNTMGHWLGRAEEARCLGKKMADRVVKQALLEVAATYHRVAEQTRNSLEKTDRKPKKSKRDNTHHP